MQYKLVQYQALRHSNMRKNEVFSSRRRIITNNGKVSWTSDLRATFKNHSLPFCYADCRTSLDWKCTSGGKAHYPLNLCVYFKAEHAVPWVFAGLLARRNTISVTVSLLVGLISGSPEILLPFKCPALLQYVSLSRLYIEFKRCFSDWLSTEWISGLGLLRLSSILIS